MAQNFTYTQCGDYYIYEIEKTEILKLDPFLKLGKPAKIAGYFGGKAGYMQAVKELEEAIYADEAV